MTTQAVPTTVRVQEIPLPEPNYPMVTRMISHPLFPLDPKQQVVGCPHCKQSISVPDPSKENAEPITWIVGQPHPLLHDLKVMRMFVDDGGVEVYSVTSDGKSGIRNLVPMGSIRLVEEAMPLPVFLEQMEIAEEENAPPEPEPEPGQEQSAENGQAPS